MSFVTKTFLVVGVFLISLTVQCCGRRFNLTKPVSDEICIMLDAEFKIRLEVEKDDSQQTRCVSSDTPKIDVSGNCATPVNGRTSTLNLRFHANNVTWSLVFQNTDGIVSLDRVIQFHPKKVFGDGHLDKGVTFNDPGMTQLSQVNESFSCNVSDEVVYNPSSVPPGQNLSVIVSVERIQVQAFEIKDNKFNPPVECGDHTVTTAPTTEHTTDTPSTAPTASPKAPLNNYLVQSSSQENITCIALESRISFIITYEVKTQNENSNDYMRDAVFDIPSDATHTGNCEYSDNEQLLSILFFNDWSLDIMFEKTEKDYDSEAQDQHDQDYSISNITLTYVMTNESFPDSVEEHNSVHMISRSGNDLPQKSKGADYYGCEVETDIDLSNDVNFRTEDMRFKAFNTNDDTKFDGNPSECSADDDSHNYVPIIVGCVIGGIVLIIIIIYGIVRYRRYKEYSEV